MSSISDINIVDNYRLLVDRLELPAKASPVVEAILVSATLLGQGHLNTEGLLTALLLEGRHPAEPNTVPESLYRSIPRGSDILRRLPSQVPNFPSPAIAEMAVSGEVTPNARLILEAASALAEQTERPPLVRARHLVAAVLAPQVAPESFARQLLTKSELYSLFIRAYQAWGNDWLSPGERAVLYGFMGLRAVDETPRSIAVWLERNAVSESLLRSLAYAAGFAGERAETALEVGPVELLFGLLQQGMQLSNREYAAGALYLDAASPDDLSRPFIERISLPKGNLSATAARRAIAELRTILLRPDAEQVLDAAAQLARGLDEDSVCARHFASALLAYGGEHWFASGAAAVDRPLFDRLAAAFLEWIGWCEPEEREALAGPVQAALATLGGLTDYAPRLSPYLSDSPDGEDHLAIGKEVEAMALVMLAEHTEPPLAIGLFGDWGSGKSFFMNKLQAKIEEFCDPEAAEQKYEKLHKQRKPFPRVEGIHHQVVQIPFNAWHYSDKELWPNLVSRVFDCLSEFYTGHEDVVKQRNTIKDELAVKQTALELTEQREAEKRQELEGVRQQRTAQEDQYQRDLERLKYLDPADATIFLRNDKAQATLGNAKQALGEENLHRIFETVVDAKGHVDTFSTELRTVWALAGKNRRPLLWVAAATGAVAGATLLINAYWPELRTWLNSAAGWIATFTVWLGTVYRAVKPYFSQANDLLKDFRTTYEALVEQQKQRPTLARQKIDELIAQEAQLSTETQQQSQQAEELRASVASLQQQLEAISAGRRLAEYIQSRCQSLDYRQYEGVVSVVRRDFECLSRFMLDQAQEAAAQQTEGGDPGQFPLRGVQRIILYIDDLDRCPVKTVVEVLQAVHLLLAFRLFVVVVGIDPAWLQKSLRQYYEVYMGYAQQEDVEENTPQRYLEKIFQVPYRLKQMDGRARQELMDALTGRGAKAPATPPAEADRPANGVSPADEVVNGTNVAEARPGQPASPADPVPPSAQPTPVTASGAANEPSGPGGNEGSPPDYPIIASEYMALSGPEQDQLHQLAKFISSPRTMKRLVNTYYILRGLVWQNSGLEWQRFQAGGFRAAQALLVALVADDRLGPLVLEGFGSLPAEERLRKTSRTNWDKPERFAEHLPAADEQVRADLVAYLGQILAENQLTKLSELRPWWPYVERFSFGCTEPREHGGS
jgi:hypothetical protein